MQKQQWTRSGKKLETLPAWKLEKVKSKKRSQRRHTKTTTKFTLLHWWDSCHPKNSKLEPQFQKYKEMVVLRGGHCERTHSWSLCSLYWTGLSSASQNAGRKSDGWHCSTTRLWRTSSWRNIGVRPGKNGGCAQAIWNSQITMSGMYGYVLQNINGRSRGNRLKILLFFLNETYTDTPLAGLLSERQFERAWMELGWEIVPNWECFLVHRKQKFFLSVYVDDINRGRKEAEFSSYVEEIVEERWYWGANIISWSRLFRMHSKGNAKPNEKIIGQYNKMFESRIPVGATEKLPGWGKRPTTWKDMLENAWNSIANWQTKRQSNYTRFPVITKLKRKSWKTYVNCQTFAPILYYKKLVPGTNWSTWHSVVSHLNWHDLSQDRLKHVTDDWHV